LWFLDPVLRTCWLIKSYLDRMIQIGQNRLVLGIYLWKVLIDSTLGNVNRYLQSLGGHIFDSGWHPPSFRSWVGSDVLGWEREMGTWGGCLLFLWWYGVWTQGFVFAKKMLYLSSHSTNSFCSGYSGYSLTFVPGTAWAVNSYFMLSPLLGWQVHAAMLSFFPLR
jgi:hypothetical protein